MTVNGVNMTQEDIFQTAKIALTLYDAYVYAVAQEIGMDRALAIQIKASEALGSQQGKMMREQSGAREYNAQTAWRLISKVPLGLGMNFEIEEESPEKVVVKCGKCSVLEAARSLGIDIKNIEAFCRVGPERFMDSMAKQLNPNLKFQVKNFRSSAEDSCEEELILQLQK